MVAHHEKPSGDAESANGRMRYIGRGMVMSLAELIYRVQEAYFHEWEVDIETTF